MQVDAIGVLWYSESDYQDFMAVFQDAGNMPSTYSDWLRIAEQQEASLKAAGSNVVRIETDVNRLVDWCRSNGYAEIDSNARGHFAAQMAAESI